MQTHGRTMEAAGSSCLGWDEKNRCHDRGPVAASRIDTALLDITDQQLRLWIYGFLHRYRVAGR